MQITEKVHLIEHCYDLTLDSQPVFKESVNSFVIFGEKITLLDSGTKSSPRAILDFLLKEKRAANAIQTLILSNSHPSIMGGASKIKELTGCKVFAHKKEREWIEEKESQYKNRPIPGIYDLMDQSVLIDEFIENNSDFRVERGLALKFYHTPGYSKGSLSALIPQEKILFAGNLLLSEKCLPLYQDFRQLKKSLCFIKNLPDVEIVLSSQLKPARTKKQAEGQLNETEEFLNKIDLLVKKHYPDPAQSNLEHCKTVLDRLGFPSSLANPVTHQAFLSHLIK